MIIDNTHQPIKLSLDGIECDAWDEAALDSQIDVPADAWSFAMYNPAMDHLPAAVRAGVGCEIYYGAELVLTGIVDALTESISRSGRTISISGRDNAGQLLDCSVPIFSGKQVSLDELINKYVLTGDLAKVIKRFEIQDNAWLKNKVSVEPGESLWDAISKAAQVTGQFAWMREDGTLMIGDPFKAATTVKTPLSLFFNGDQNNVLSLEYTEDVSNVFSDFKLMTQDGDAEQILSQSKNNTAYSYNRLKIISFSEAETKAEADAALNKITKDNNLEAYTLTAEVVGWAIDGKTWQTGWLIDLQTDVLIRANSKWMIIGRTLNLSRMGGQTTTLKLKRQGDWAQPLLYKDPEAKNKTKISKSDKAKIEKLEDETTKAAEKKP